MGFNLGAFAGGIGAGIEQGTDIRERYRKMADEQRQRMAEGVAARIESDSLLQQTPLNPPSNQSPVAPIGGVAPNPAPTQVPLPGAQPMPGATPGGGPSVPPPAAAGPPQQPPAGPAAMGPPAQPVPQGAPPPQPPPASPPGGGPGGGAGPAPASPSGPPGQADLMKQLSEQRQAQQKQLATWLQEAIKLGGPAFQKDPSLAFEAVQQIIAQNKDMDQSDKTLLAAELKFNQEQIAWVHNQQTAAIGQQNADTRKTGEQDQHADRLASIKASLQRTALAQSEADKRESMRDATRLQAEDIVQAGANGRTQAMIDARAAINDANLDEKTWQTELGAALREQGMSDAFISKLFAAQTAGAPVGQGPKAPLRPIVQKPTTPSGRGGAPAKAAAPPVQGARQAPDGKWYVSDPKRPGKYLMVQ